MAKKIKEKVKFDKHYLIVTKVRRLTRPEKNRPATVTFNITKEMYDIIYDMLYNINPHAYGLSIAWDYPKENELKIGI